MGYVHKKFCRIMAFILTVMLCGGVFSAGNITVEAKEEQAVFQLYVTSPKENFFVGDFLVSGDALYLSTATLFRMCDAEEMNVQSADHEELYRLARGTSEALYTAEQIIDREGVRYVPFAETLTQLCLGTEFDSEYRILSVTELNGMNDLMFAMDEILDDEAYNMLYWQNSKNFAGDVASAMAADCIKNLSFVSYGLGLELEADYEEIYWKIVYSDNQEELTFLQDTPQEIKNSQLNFKIGGDLLEFIGKKFETPLDKISKTGKYGVPFKIAKGILKQTVFTMDMDKIAEMAVVSELAANVSESCVRGLELAVYNSNDMSHKAILPAKSVIAVYRKEKPVDQIIFENWVEKFVKDEINGSLFDMASIAEVFNRKIDEKLNTQRQVDGTILAACALSVQSECASYYRTRRTHYVYGPWENKPISMQNMHDVITAYLYAGIEAQRAVNVDAEDKNMNSAVSSVIQRAEKDLSLLAKYTESDFQMLIDLPQMQEELVAYYKQLNTSGVSLTLEVPEVKGSLLVALGETDGYPPVDAMGEPYELEVQLEGSTEEGSYITSQLEGQVYFSKDKRPMAKVTEQNGQTYLEFLDLDAFYTITISSATPTNGWAQYTIIDLNIPGVTNFNPEKYYMRGATGMWYYSIRIEDGKPAGKEISAEEENYFAQIKEKILNEETMFTFGYYSSKFLQLDSVNLVEFSADQQGTYCEVDVKYKSDTYNGIALTCKVYYMIDGGGILRLTACVPCAWGNHDQYQQMIASQEAQEYLYVHSNSYYPATATTTDILTDHNRYYKFIVSKEQFVGEVKVASDSNKEEPLRTGQLTVEDCLEDDVDPGLNFILKICWENGLVTKYYGASIYDHYTFLLYEYDKQTKELLPEQLYVIEGIPGYVKSILMRRAQWAN